jgi:hypothetical protein
MSIYLTCPMVGFVNNRQHIDLASAISYVYNLSLTYEIQIIWIKILSHISLSSNHHPSGPWIQIRPIPSCQLTIARQTGCSECTASVSETFFQCIALLTTQCFELLHQCTHLASGPWLMFNQPLTLSSTLSVDQLS